MKRIFSRIELIQMVIDAEETSVRFFAGLGRLARLRNSVTGVEYDIPSPLQIGVFQRSLYSFTEAALAVLSAITIAAKDVYGPETHTPDNIGFFKPKLA